MAKWNEYGLKSGTSAEDEVLILDSDTDTNKRTTVGDIQEFANGKVLEKENSTLNTEAKTLIGAINEVDAKNDAQDTKIEEVENKFSDYLKKTDVDSTLSVSGSPADAKVVGEQFKKNEEAITDLADKKITKFYASNQGNTHLPDSDKGKIQDMFLYGKSEQVQYKGKNLFNKYSYRPNKYIEDEYGNLADSESIYTTNDIYIKKGVTVSISSTGTKRRGYYNKDKTKFTYLNSNASTFTAPEDCYLVISCNYDTTAVDKFQVEIGETATSYEPYTGGIPSPNPDYPQEIKAVVNPKVVVRGKNLLKNTQNTIVKNGVTFTVNADKTVTVNGTATVTTNFIYGKMPANGKTYKLVGCPKGQSVTTIWLDLSNYKDTSARDGGNGNTLTLTGSYEYIVQITIASGITVNNLVFKPMVTLEMSATYDDYEPYTEQSTTLPYTLYAIPVSTGGNITIGGKQYVADYVDVERGKLVRNVYKYSLTNIKELYTHGVNKVDGLTGFYVYTDKESIPKIGGRNAISPFFTYNQSSWGGQQLGMSLADTESYITITVKTNILDDSSSNTNAMASFKKFCKENSIYLIYQLATPEEIDLTPEQIQAFKSLSTNYPVTNIEVSSDQLDGYTVFNYPISMAEGWNYVKQQIGDTRDYIYDMDLQSAEAYVNSEYAVALTELEVM